MGKISLQQNQQSNRTRHLEIIFEFACPNPKLTNYRAVKATDGGYRMERRGAHAQKFKAFMWCGSKISLYQQKEITESCHKTGVLAFSFLASSEQI